MNPTDRGRQGQHAPAQGRGRDRGGDRREGQEVVDQARLKDIIEKQEGKKIVIEKGMGL